MSDTVTPGCPIRLGIACVYFYGQQTAWVLELQLKYLAHTLAGYDYTIYAGANRLQPELRRTLEQADRVTIVDLPQYAGEGNREHAFYLDRLLWAAAEDGCTHLCALDSDSFPIARDWPRLLLARMGATRFAAVHRSENEDTYLPHPCGYFMQRSFLMERRPQLFPSDDELAGADFQAFLAATGQRVDTGIGYGFQLWRSGESWLRLERSNKTDLHFLMAGVYGGIFFHLGASSRRPAFHRDYSVRPSLRLAQRLRNRTLMWRLAALLEDRYISANTRTFGLIESRLKSDADKFLAELDDGSLAAGARPAD